MDTDVQSCASAVGRPLFRDVKRKNRWHAFRRSGFWRAGLVMVSSAALGGVAVALWNRKTLRAINREADGREE